MAIRNLTIFGGNGINFTKETDSSADWSSIANGTYFRDVADGLIHYKNSTGGIVNTLDTSANRVLRINSQAGDYTAAIADFNSDTFIRMTSGSANSFTIPLNSSVAFPIGTQLLIAQTGAGQTTIVATSGVTINAVGLKISARYNAVTLIQVALNEWSAYGSLTA